jgi:hypothetical protein
MLAANLTQGILKFVKLFILSFLISQPCYSQDNLALVKEELKSVCVYDSTLKIITFKVKPQTFFSCDSLEGNWYIFNIPYLFNGRIHKDSIQFFKSISLSKKRRLIDMAFDSFSKLCDVSSDNTIDTLIQNEYNDSIFRNKRDLYYDQTFFPMLGEFYSFYFDTKNQTSLLKLLNTLNCGPDGDFAETFYPLLGYCYDIDKNKFITTLNNIRNTKTRSSYRNALLEEIWEYYQQKYYRKKLSQDQIDGKVHLEKQRILKLTKVSR